MASRDLDRLAKRVHAHRLELYPSRKAAADAAGISKDTWKKVEVGIPVQDVKYAQIERVLGWGPRSCVAIAEGGEPVLTDESALSSPVATPSAPLTADAVREAVLEAARAKMPNAPIGDIDALGDELVEVLRRTGQVSNGD